MIEALLFFIFSFNWGLMQYRKKHFTSEKTEIQQRGCLGIYSGVAWLGL
jgi:hypothetical protein